MADFYVLKALFQKCCLFVDVSSQQRQLKLGNRAFLAINQVERKSLISKSNKGSSQGHPTTIFGRIPVRKTI